jgi:endonuclease/exonuclease/phosphatase family metal-dependent hydrolase
MVQSSTIESSITQPHHARVRAHRLVGVRRPKAVCAVVACAILLLGCAVRRAPAGLPGAPPCVATVSAEGAAPIEVEWRLRDAIDERAALDAWCWAVGPAVLADFTGPSRPASLDSLAVVVWNAEVGHGRLAELIGDLRSGALMGQPVREFVLLLQEVHRAGSAIPDPVPEWAAVPRRTGDPRAPGRVDVVEVARRLGLSLLYAPSMRNGHKGDGPAEDRGNAILSTLDLASPTALELPYERQRRVAVLASVEVRNRAGEPFTLRFASVHLDNRARFGRIHRTFGAARAAQARALLADVSITRSQAVVVGGDLNTWVPGADAAAVDVFRSELPLPADPPSEGTHELPGPAPRLRLDHLFFRLPQGWRAQYRVADSTYGSDHHPLLGWIRIDSTARSRP